MSGENNPSHRRGSSISTNAADCVALTQKSPRVAPNAISELCRKCKYVLALKRYGDVVLIRNRVSVMWRCGCARLATAERWVTAAAAAGRPLIEPDWSQSGLTCSVQTPLLHFPLGHALYF